jgi:hypothetical protein
MVWIASVHTSKDKCMSEWLCLTLIQQFTSYIMAKTSKFWMRWWAFAFSLWCCGLSREARHTNCIVWPDRGSNPRSTALEARTLIITPPMWLSVNVWVSDCCLTPTQQSSTINRSFAYKAKEGRYVRIVNNLYTLGSFYGVSGWLLLNANSVSFQLYHGENKLIFNEMMMRSALFKTTRLTGFL